MKAHVEELFHEVADLSPSEREKYFTEHGVEDEIRCEVEALLAFDAGATEFLENDVSAAAMQALPQLEPRHRRCGPYRLLHMIGRGGMGAVYLAERADGEVMQRVAIKLLPPGAGDAYRERFLQERQIFASLIHANIARMMDAGHLDNGQPFLAMEYVDGRPIDVFASGLPVRQKVGLFLKVCSAVSYLHRNLVVHRDLKPSNILVTAEGEPKLLDFGIAKLLDVTTDTTATAMRMLTPDYASPEQVTGERVSTATDIYSLGAVLYRLLTSRPAHEFADQSAAAIARVVTSREVTRPSKWTPELKGDLEAILMKALRKDPLERYVTVEQMVEDLEAFLESRPVRARSGNTGYRARKFFRRYWIQLVAAALILFSLTAGLYVANRERALAQRRFQDVRQLANKLFDIDAQVRELAGSTKARQLIVDTSLEYLRRLVPDLRGDPDLTLELATAYMRVGRVQGVPITPNLGHMDQAARTLRTAEGLIQYVLSVQPSNRMAMLRSAQIAHDRMILARLGGRPDEALALARKSAAWLEKFRARESDKAEASGILAAYLNVAEQFNLSDEYDEALRLCRRGTEIAKLFHSESYAGDLLWVSADVYRIEGDFDKALRDIRESVRLLAPDPGSSVRSPVSNYAMALIKEGRILGEDGAVSMGKSEEAVLSLDQAFQITDELVHKDPLDQSARGRLAMAGLSLAGILRHTDPVRALGVYDHALRHLGEIKGNASFEKYEVSALTGSSYPLRRLRRPDEARKRLDAALERLHHLKLYPAEKIDVSEVHQFLSALADHEAETGNLRHAIGIYQDLLNRLEAEPDVGLDDAMTLSNIWRSLAPLYRRTGQPDLASALDAKRLDLWRRWDRKLPNNPFVLNQIAAKPVT